MFSFNDLPKDVHDLKQEVRELKGMLSQLLTSPKTTHEGELLTSPQLKKMFKISEPTLITLRKRGLPFISVGNSYRYELQSVLKYLQKNGK